MMTLMWVWFNPAIPPIIAPVTPRNATGRSVVLIRRVIIIRGRIFCQVVRVMQIGQVEFIITWGNQKCMGAAPSLVVTPIKVMADEVVIGFTGNMGLWVVVRSEIRIIVDPKAWARKYFIAASASLFV